MVAARLAVTRQSSQRVAQRDDHRLVVRAGENELEIAAVFNLFAKFAKFVGERLDHIAAQIGNHYRNVAARHVRMAGVLQLAGDDNAVEAGLVLDGDIDLVRISAIEHLPCPGADRAGARGGGTQKTVENELREGASAFAGASEIRTGEGGFG